MQEKHLSLGYVEMEMLSSQKQTSPRSSDMLKHFQLIWKYYFLI